MNTRLHGARGIKDTNPARARNWIEREGGEIVKEAEQSHRDGSTRTQFTVQVDGEMWFLRPFGPKGTYSWMQLPT